MIKIRRRKSGTLRFWGASVCINSKIHPPHRWNDGMLEYACPGLPG